MHTLKKVLLAKLEEEDGGQDVAREQLRGVILVLGVVLIDAIPIPIPISIALTIPIAMTIPIPIPIPIPIAIPMWTMTILVTAMVMFLVLAPLAHTQLCAPG